MRACNSNGGIKVVGGWLSPMGRAHGVNIWPVRSKYGVGPLCLGEGPRAASFRDGGNRVRLVSQSNVTSLSCRWKG